jgi:hypothetical protein
VLPRATGANLDARTSGGGVRLALQTSRCKIRLRLD